MTPHRIPNRLNLAIAAAVMAACVVLLGAAGRAESAAALGALALGYGIVMNTGYALIHEAEHGMFHPSPRWNAAAGVVLALFFPAPFHLIRQGHLGHHMRNRSDDEAFDFYFEGENPVWKYAQLYGTLTGMFWLVIALSNFAVVVSPKLLLPRYGRFDRPTESLLESLNPRYQRMIRAEAFAAITLHAALMWGFGVAWWRYAAVLAGFGFIWSAMQYAHHFGAARDVQKGARNLRTFALIDKLWLNHNWHLNHHMRPTVPWIHLPGLFQGEEYERRGSLTAAYFRMWRGPRFTTERIENRFAGRIIR
ncbi:MAG: fatty acid desaturase family protein [Bryobacteraceae bacterium]